MKQTLKKFCENAQVNSFHFCILIDDEHFSCLSFFLVRNYEENIFLRFSLVWRWKKIESHKLFLKQKLVEKASATLSLFWWWIRLLLLSNLTSKQLREKSRNFPLLVSTFIDGCPTYLRFNFKHAQHKILSKVLCAVTKFS